MVRSFVTVGGDLTFIIDETLERCWRPRIRWRGPDRAPLASSNARSRSSSGVRWLVHTPLEAALLGAPWVERARPHPGGQSSVGTAAQHGATTGTTETAAGAPLMAHGQAHPHRRPNRACPRAGDRLGPSGDTRDCPACTGCRFVRTRAATLARHPWLDARQGRAAAAAGGR